MHVLCKTGSLLSQLGLPHLSRRVAGSGFLFLNFVQIISIELRDLLRPLKLSKALWSWQPVLRMSKSWQLYDRSQVILPFQELLKKTMHKRIGPQDLQLARWILKEGLQSFLKPVLYRWSVLPIRKIWGVHSPLFCALPPFLNAVPSFLA